MNIPYVTTDATHSPIRVRKAILTYHRVLEEPKYHGVREWKFYDLPAPRFRQQMEKVAARARAYEAGALLPRLELTFDDGTEDHLAVADMLAKLDLSGIFFIIAGRLGAPGYLSRLDLRALLDLGQRLGSHSVTHRKIDELTDAELRLELEQSRDVLQQAIGREVEWFAPAGGFVNQRCVQVARNCGYRFVRTMRWGYATTTQTGEISCIPVLPRTSNKAFDRIINGNASFPVFQLKEAMKRILGERTYIALRGRFGNEHNPVGRTTPSPCPKVQGNGSQPVSKGELYAILARRFLTDGIDAFLWRDADVFPRLVGLDMDIVAANAQSWKRIDSFIEMTLARYGWRILRRIRRGGVHTFLTGRANGALLNEDDFLQIDVHRYLTASAVPYVDLATLVERAVTVDGAPFLSQADGATISILGPILNGVRPKARYELAFAEAQRSDPERVRDVFAQALGNRERAEALLKPGVPVIGLWRRALFNALRRRPVTACRVLFSIATERLSAFFYPAGRMISVSGPDGVGKTSVISTLSALARRRICIDVCIYHTRPYLIPRLAHFLPQHRKEKILTTRGYERRSSHPKSWLRLALLILDYNLGYWIKIRPRLARGQLVIFDRHFLDIRANPRIQGIELSQRILGRVDSLIPRPDLRVVLTARAGTITSRKRELTLSEAENQLTRYLSLASQSTNCLVLETDDTSPRELGSRILKRLSQPNGQPS